MDDEGRYQGDLDYESLEDLVREQGLLVRWQKLGIELGLAPPPDDDPPMSAEYRQGRCFNAVFSAGVWYLSEFHSMCEETPLKRDFIHSVNRLSSLAGHRMVALPEDLLTLLVVYGRRSFFGEARRHDLGFKSQITDALADVLPIHALLGEQQRSEFTHNDGEPPHRDGEG